MTASNVPPSPASEEMPESVRKRVELVRRLYADLFPHGEPTPHEEATLVLNDDAIAIHWLTRELSEARARAVQGEQEEREACAQVAESWLYPTEPRDEYERQNQRMVHGIAKMIRARTSTPTPDTGRNDSDE